MNRVVVEYGSTAGSEVQNGHVRRQKRIDPSKKMYAAMVSSKATSGYFGTPFAYNGHIDSLASSRTVRVKVKAFRRRPTHYARDADDRAR